MSVEDYWEGYTSLERDLFQKSCRRLLKCTFIVRDKDEDSKKAYYFVSKKPDPFSKYFGYIGFDIIVDRENGIIMLRNCADVGENGKIQANRIALKKVESVVLCCLWTLYADKVRSGSLAQAIMISVTDLRFELEKYGVKDLIDKTTMINILALFTKFNLIGVNGSVGDEECMIRLYPSLQFALDSEEFKVFARDTEKRMIEKAGEIAGDEEDDNADD